MEKKIILIFLIFIILNTGSLFAQQGNTPVPLPKVTIGLDTAQNPSEFTVTLQIIFLMTILTLAPAILIMITSFTRIVIVFHFIRQALGTQQIPPNQILIGLALFLTFYIMAPTWGTVHKNAIRPYLDGQITQQQAYENAIQPVREFLLKHTREKDLALFIKLSSDTKPTNASEVSTLVLVPAFAISELRIAFQIQ